jgi:dynein heavy chain
MMSCCHQGSNQGCNLSHFMWVHVTWTRQDQASMWYHPVGEKIDWIEAVDPSLTGAVELWMGEVEGVIRRTLHKLAGQALAVYATTQRSKWILEWPGQLVLNCSQVSLCL